jgi:hypothetical protein
MPAAPHTPTGTLLDALIVRDVVSAVALTVPHADATAPASARTMAGNMVTAEQVALKCLRRRVCRPGQGCAWRKICKRW